MVINLLYWYIDLKTILKRHFVCILRHNRTKSYMYQIKKEEMQ